MSVSRIDIVAAAHPGKRNGRNSMVRFSTADKLKALTTYADGRDWPSATAGLAMTAALLRDGFIENGPGMTERITALGAATLAKWTAS
jgi:hypothetical protein